MGLPGAANPFAARSLGFAKAASTVVAAAGLLVVVGWLWEIPRLTALYLPGPTLKTNAALALTCGALANLLLISSPAPRRRIAAGALAAIPAVIGALTLSQHVVGWDLGIDQVLATEPAGAEATMSPNRMGPIASSSNMLLGIALVLAHSRSSRMRAISNAITSAVCITALLPLIGYAYGFSELYGIAQYTGIAMVTAVAILTLALAIQAGRPDVGLVSYICREDEVGLLARRLMPAAVGLPFGLGWLLARLLGAGLFDTPFALSAMSLVLIVLLVTLIWRTSMQLAVLLEARAETERALSESERSLRDADRQKTEFLATLSHELRNPLAPIRFAVELLNGPPSSAERARNTIDRQVQHLTRLIDDLLDLTRITRNKLELHVRPCDLRLLVHEAVDGVANEMARARHELEIDLPGYAVWLQVDPERAVQMLVNLLTNATRYSDPEGKIRIAAVVDRSDVTVSVRDSGHGIARADLDRVFERFVQVGKTQHGGLGIGLALVRALAELHGGSAEAYSEGPGRGSEFRLRLPRATSPAVEARAPDRLEVPSRRILVVDDNRDAADMLNSLLSSSGHEVVVAYSGEEALERAVEFKPQVGLLDIGMAGMDGYQLARRLRGDSQLPELFLVAITGWGQEEDRRRALAAGFDAHLTKPADPLAITTLLASRFSPAP
jgi:signal transduction histidine kinase/CheY-like chemotaxis protein